MSYETFGIHLRHLQTNGLLGNTKKGYFLKEKAYFLQRHKILEFNRPNRIFLDPVESEEVEKRLKMLFIVSYFGLQRSFYPLQSKEEFEEFLARYNLHENDLRVFEEYDIETKGSLKHIKNFFPVSGIFEIQIVEETADKISYGYYLPGFGVADLVKALDRRTMEFYYVDFERSDLQEEIDMLLAQRLLEEVGGLINKKRYRFPEPLQLVLGKCKNLNDDILSVMLGIFECHRGPNEAEKKWLEFFYGNIEDTLQEFRHSRKYKKGKKKKSIHDIKQSMISVHGNFENLIDSLNSSANTKYRTFVHVLLEYIYPAFMRKSFSSGVLYYGL
ncbi:hypothetical protein [Nitrososphaera sp. AFS]|uniref:hypothetical protein n=1 Tax=Nitrososphaera sp. AFS TaxID=2301191 RepID=UPI0013923B92|nr:hypothetical protein [Nitrososphaera sp. AFS]